MTTMDIMPKKCGVRFSPPAIIITYSIGSSTTLHRRTMPLRQFTKNSGIPRAADELRKNPRHARYLEKLPAAQLEKLISMIHDQLNGISKDEIIAKAKKMEHIDPDEDLNLVDEGTLKFKKALMDQTFEKNRKRPEDPDFQYDVEVDFDTGPIETCEWDSDKDSDIGF